MPILTGFSLDVRDAGPEEMVDAVFRCFLTMLLPSVSGAGAL